MNRKYSFLLLVALLSASIVLAQYGGYEQPKKSLKSSASSAYLNKESQSAADKYAAESASSNAQNANEAAAKQASYAAGQNVNRNVLKQNAAIRDIGDVHTKKDSAFARGNNKIYKDSYDKVSSTSDITCSRLKRFAREIKKTYYNANSYDRKVLQSDVQKLRIAKAQLQSIIGHALKQAYVKSGYKNADSRYKTADDYKNQNNQYANQESSSLYKAANSAESKNKGRSGYSFFLQQQYQVFYQKLAQLTSQQQEAVEFTKMIEESQDYVTSVCDRYSNAMTTITKQSCDGLKELAVKGSGYDYCKQDGLAIGSYIKEGYLARKQLCHAGQSLKFLKQIYSGVYDLYSGYRSSYLNKVYANIYARRKNLCAQDETHSQIYNSVIAKNSEQVSGKSGNKYGNIHNKQAAADRENVNNYENKFKKASGAQNANNHQDSNYYARENKEGSKYGNAASTRKANEDAKDSSVTTQQYKVKTVVPKYEVVAYERPQYPTQANGYSGSYSFLIQDYGSSGYTSYVAPSSYSGSGASSYGGSSYSGKGASSYGGPSSYSGSGASTYGGPSSYSGSKASSYGGSSYPSQKVLKTVYRPIVKYQTKYHVYPKQYQKHTDYAKQLRKAYKSGYQAGQSQGNKAAYGAKSASSYYYSGYFIQSNPYAQMAADKYSNDLNLNKAYNQGYKNGYQRQYAYKSGSYSASSYGTGKQNSNCAQKQYAPISTYQPVYGQQLKHLGHGVAEANIYKQIPKVNKLQCEMACESYGRCRSYGYQADNQLCNLYPNDLIGHIKAGLFTEITQYNQLDNHKTYPVLHYRTTHPVEYCAKF